MSNNSFTEIELKEGEKIYFSSDNHLGAPNHAESLVREKRFVDWLDSIKDDAKVIFLLGDLFDFWFEYKKVVPKGFVRSLGKLAELTDSGIKIYFFVGNHDLWMNGYFQEELNIPVFHKPQNFSIAGKKMLIGHGDGLGPGDKGFKRMKKVFTNSLCKFMFTPKMGEKFDKKTGVIISTFLFGLFMASPFNLRIFGLFPENGDPLLLGTYLIFTTECCLVLYSVKDLC